MNTTVDWQATAETAFKNVEELANTVVDLRRELDKAREALTGCQTHLARHAEANAALHCADRVMYSPLHAKVDAAIAGIEHALKRTDNDT